MDAYERVLSAAFQRGCGVEVSDVRMSAEYRNLLSYFRWCGGEAASAPGSAWNIAAEMGPTVFGASCAIAGSVDATLEAGHHMRLGTGFYPQLLADFVCLSRSLIRKAREHLPTELLALAAEWRRSEADRQIQLLVQIAELLQKDESVSRDEEAEAGTIPRGIFPSTAADENDPVKLTCLGLVQKLAAFAQVCESRAYYADPLIPIEVAALRWHSTLFSEFLREAECRQMLTSRVRDEAKFGFDDWCQTVEGMYPDFHGSVILTDRDDGLLVLDPFLNTWGYLPDQKIARQTLRSLDLFYGIHPGLSLVLPQADVVSKIFGKLALKQRALMYDAFRLVEEMRRMAVQRGNHVSAAFFASTRMAKEIARLVYREVDRHSEKALGHLVSQLLYNGTEAGFARFEREPEFRGDQLSRLMIKLPSERVIGLHAAISNAAKGLGVVAPFLEIGHVDFALAVRVINEVACRLGLISEVVPLLGAVSYSQLVIANLISHGQWPLMGIRKIALRLPVRHQALQRVLVDDDQTTAGEEILPWPLAEEHEEEGW